MENISNNLWHHDLSFSGIVCFANADFGGGRSAIVAAVQPSGLAALRKGTVLSRDAAVLGAVAFTRRA
jgi:hypothetical protein